MNAGERPAEDRRNALYMRAQQNSAAARLTMHLGVAAGLTAVFWVPLVSSKLAKMLGFKGYLPLPLSPTPRSKPELGQPLLSRERAKLRGRGKTEKWDSPLI